MDEETLNEILLGLGEGQRINREMYLNVSAELMVLRMVCFSMFATLVKKEVVSDYFASDVLSEVKQVIERDYGEEPLASGYNAAMDLIDQIEKHLRTM